MTEDERQARRVAVAAIAKLSIAYDKEMSDEQIDIYINAIHDVSDSLEDAVNSIISTERFFPSVATIRSVALRDANRLGAEDAWGVVIALIQSRGRLAKTKGLSPEIRAALDAVGGYQALCATEKIDAARYSFTKAYNAHIERADRQAAEAWFIPKHLKAQMQQIGRGPKEI